MKYSIDRHKFSHYLVILGAILGLSALFSSTAYAYSARFSIECDSCTSVHQMNVAMMNDANNRGLNGTYMYIVVNPTDKRAGKFAVHRYYVPKCPHPKTSSNPNLYNNCAPMAVGKSGGTLIRQVIRSPMPHW